MSASDRPLEEPTIAARFDSLLCRLEGSSAEQAPSLVEVLSVLAIEGTDAGALTAETLIRAEYDGERRALFLAGLLRVIAHRPDFLDDAVRNPAFKVLREKLPAAVFRAASVKADEQTYILEEKLRNLALGCEKRLGIAVSALSSLDNLGGYRQSVMKELNQPTALILVAPFLPSRAANDGLATAFKVVESYARSGVTEAVGERERAVRELDHFQAEVAAFGTHYSRAYLGTIGATLRGAIDRHFENSSASKPAALRAGPSEKLYPLDEPGRRFDAVLIVSNDGEGRAEGALVRATDWTGNMILRSPDVFLGRFEGPQQYVHIGCEVVDPDNVGMIEGEITWTNIDGSQGRNDFEVLLKAQRSDIDFKALADEEPYSLEPVDTEEELVGRTDQLNKLMASTGRRQLGSCILWGQKRVGKTSLVKALADRLGRERDDVVSIYIDGGEYVNEDARVTISNLGVRFCSEVRDSDPRLHHLEIPRFNGALSPVADFLRACTKVAPDLRLFVILDEFDGLPIDLYKPGGLGDAFFLTLRSLSGKADLGFVLVGGEKMQYIVSNQGHHLNKFQTLRIDYFDADEHWADFLQLVRRPVNRWLEITDRAVRAIYDQSAGNPFFAKLICRELFTLAVSRSDSHITEDEVQAAASHVVRFEAVSSFQHFWSDGIIDIGPQVEHVSIRRRKILLALTRLLRNGTETTAAEIVREADALDVPEREVREELEAFVRRQVLEAAEGAYHCKVPLFEAWLIDRGAAELLTAALAAEEMQRLREEEQRHYVTANEIVDLVETWGNYRGMRVAEERVRAWLNQFPDDRDRRLMFTMLGGIRFYAHDLIRQKLAEAHRMVGRGLSYELDEKQRKRNEFLVSYLDAVGKSGAMYARLYVEENGIYRDNILEKSQLGTALEKMPATQALVFVDDFVGSGDTIATALRELAGSIPDLFDGSRVRAYIVVVCGFAEGLAKVEAAVSELGLKVKIRVCDELGRADRCFDTNSELFASPADRERAQEIAAHFGRRLVKAAPLGYAGGQALVVFEHGIPNNCPAILWAKSGSWAPLFPRD